MVTLSLFDTLLGLYNEEIMNELILKYVLNAQHIPISQRHKINKIQCYANTVDYFLDLAPEVMKNSTKISNENSSMDYQLQLSSLGPELLQTTPLNIPSGPTSLPPSNVSKTIGANWNHYGLHSGGGHETLYANYHAYLFEAHLTIKKCKMACDQWNNSYYYKPSSQPKEKRMPNEELVQMIKQFLAEFPVDETSSAFNNNQMVDEHINNSCNKMDSLQSIGESSGYESFKYRPEEDDEVQQHKSDSSFSSNITIVKSNVPPWLVSNCREEQIIELDFSEDLFAQGTVSLGEFILYKFEFSLKTFSKFAGPFFTSIWNKLQTFTSNCLYVNLHLTGLIAHICYYPLPLVHSILLRPDIPTTSDTPSFYQVLKILKQQIDAELPLSEESLEMIDIGRTFLIDREFKIINARKIALEAHKSPSKSATINVLPSSSGNASNSSTAQVSIYDPFKRQEKKKTLGNTFTSMFRRPSAQSQGEFFGIFYFLTRFWSLKLVINLKLLGPVEHKNR